MTGCLSIVLTVEPYAGSSIERSAKDAVLLQSLMGGTVVLLFNDIVLRIRNGTTVDEVCDQYHDDLGIRRAGNHLAGNA